MTSTRRDPRELPVPGTVYRYIMAPKKEKEELQKECVYNNKALDSRLDERSNSRRIGTKKGFLLACLVLVVIWELLDNAGSGLEEFTHHIASATLTTTDAIIVVATAENERNDAARRKVAPQAEEEAAHTTSRLKEKPSPAFARPQKCTMDQLLKVRHQLPPELCVEQLVTKRPYYQLCSFTTATKCPKATWLEEYYLELQRTYSNNTSNTAPPPPFLGISVGCNKGFDAINTLRMGTFDDSIEKDAWKKAMTHDGSELFHSVCNQHEGMSEILEPYRKESGATTGSRRDKYLPRPHGEMHCIEPMPQTFHKLNHSATVLGYKEKGLTVIHGAVSKESSEMFFPAGLTGGVENQGLESCQNLADEERRRRCVPVRVFSLVEYVKEEVKAKISRNPINILSIDVEGFDGDVLLGATSDVLKRVEYLEFEYNWMGSWKAQHLYDVIEMLDTRAGFTCYWAGINRLWRITDCWMAYYDVKSWSNIACANRNLASQLAAKMEDIFHRSLDDQRQWIKDNHDVAKLKQLGRKYVNHALMSTEEEKLTSKYFTGAA